MVRTQFFSKITKNEKLLKTYVYKYNNYKYISNKNFKKSKYILTIFFLKKYIYNFFIYKNNFFIYKNNFFIKYLFLNFKRNRIFPSLSNSKKKNYFNISLGMFSKFFNKPKGFLKNKQVYLLLTNFIKKVIVYTSIKHIILFIKKLPKYFNEIINNIELPSNSLYNNPFTNEIVDEKIQKNYFNWVNIFFLNNRPFGLVKLKKKGRLKRKIKRKIILINQIND